MSHPRANRLYNVKIGFAIAAPAAAWLIHLSASYLLAAYACDPGNVWIFHMVTVVAVALAGAGLWSGWLCWRQLNATPTEVMPGQRFMAILAIALATLLIFVIIVAELSNFLLEPCL